MSVASPDYPDAIFGRDNAMGWIFVAVSVLGFLWALLIHLRMTLIYLGVIPTPPGALCGGVSLVLASRAAVATIRTIAWSIVLLVVEWPVLVTWIALVLTAALFLESILLFTFSFEWSDNPILKRESRKEVYGRFVFVFIGAVVFVVCVYKLGI